MIHEVKHKTLILEGVNCSGKDTIKRLINIRTNFKYSIINRYLGSQFVYGTLYNRDVDYYRDFFFIEKCLKDFCYLIYLDASYDEIVKRINNRKRESEEASLSDFFKIKNLYEKYLFITPLTKIVVNTTDLTPDQVVSNILEEIERKENNERKS